jgi:ADP-ribose pyrophosphatase
MDGENGGVIYRGNLLTLLTRREAGPDGGEILYEIVEHPPAVAIVAIARPAGQQPEVALVRQLRPAVGGEIWEIPAGLTHVRDGETPEAAARRELREEVGAEGGVWTELGQVYTSPGFTDERITIFLADNVSVIPGTTPDPHEITSLNWKPLASAIQQAESGEQGDAKTALGLLLARDQLAKKGVAMFEPNAPGGTPFAPPERVSSPNGGVGDLNLENMLLQEFSYANSTAYQALEDRARMFSFYLGLVGALLTAIGVIAQMGGGYAAEIIIAMLVVVGAAGVAFFLQLIRLRQAWRDSAITMNIIKEHYILTFKDVPNVAKMFRWRLSTVPKGEKRTGISFVICTIVALLASLSFAAAALLAANTWLVPALNGVASIRPFADAFPWVIAVVVALIVYGLQQSYFSRTLDAKKESQSVANAAKIAGLPLEVLNPPA